MANDPTWTELVAPIVAKCEVGTKFGDRVVFTKDGADALGKLLQVMAARLDADLEAISIHGQSAPK